MATDVQGAVRQQESAEPVSVRLHALQLNEDERRADGGSWRRRIIWLLVILIIAGGVGAATQLSGGGNAEVKEVQAITFGDQKQDEIVLDLTGYIVPHRRVNITPRSAGTIVEFPVQAGQRVTKGQLIAQVDPTTYRAEYLQAKAALAMAEQQLRELQNGALPEEIAQAKALCESARSVVDYLKSELDRKRQLRKSHPQAVTEAEMDSLLSKLIEAQAAYEKAQQSRQLIEKGPREEKIAAAQAEVERNRAMVESRAYWLENTKLTSPIDGVVLEKKAEAGEDVHPELVFTSLCIIADLENMEAEVDVQEADLQRIKIGQPCDVIPDAYSERVYRGVVDRIVPFVSRARGTVAVKVKIQDADERLLVDMNCRVIFKRDPADAAAQAQKAPRVPESAVVKEPESGQSYVFVVQNNTAAKRLVTAGAKDGDQVEILSGLEKGDIVVVSAGNDIQEGQPLRARL